MTSSTSYAESPRIPEVLYEMGSRMKKFSNWIWIVAIASFFGIGIGSIPLIIGLAIYDEITMIIGAVILFLATLVISCLGLYLVYLYYQYMNSIKDIRDATGDPLFEKIYQYMLIAFILMIFNFAILIIASIILNILALVELEKWATRMERALPTPEMTNVNEGYRWLKLAAIISIVFAPIGIMTPISYSKIGKALMAEYNSSQFDGIGTTRAWPMESTIQRFTPAPPTQSYAAPAPPTQSYAAPAPRAPAPQKSEVITCPHCGTVTPKHLAGKFCGKCGKSYGITTSSQPAPSGQTYKPVDDIARCPHCGAENPKGTVFCEVCGKSL